MLYLAPLHGYTDYYFRNTYAKYFKGIDMAVAPFVSLVEGKRVKPSVIRDILPENNSLMPVIPQVIGHKADQFIMMAKTLSELGYDSLNWNLGCPMKAITKKRRGAGLLPYPELIEYTLEKVVAAIPIKLSLKVRLGMENKDEIFRLIPIFNQYPLDFVIVHPRLGIQNYDGPVDLESFSLSLKQLNHRVIYNGDINSTDSFEELKTRFPQQNDWMLGRGILQDLFLPWKLKGDFNLSSEKQKLIARDFHMEFIEMIVKRWEKEKTQLNKIKEFWEYFHRMYEGGSGVYKKILRSHDLNEINGLVYEVTGNDITDSFLTDNLKYKFRKSIT